MSLDTDFFEAFRARPRPLPTQMLRPAGNHELDRLRELLLAKTPSELSAYEIQHEVESYLWALTPEAFRYFLPAFLHASLESYASISIFVSELVGALTKPDRGDLESKLDRLTQMPPGVSLPGAILEPLLKGQRQWIDSGAPMARFHESVDGLTRAEGAAVLAFFDALKKAHGEDYPFDELQTAVDRYWIRYRTE